MNRLGNSKIGQTCPDFSDVVSARAENVAEILSNRVVPIAASVFEFHQSMKGRQEIDRDIEAENSKGKHPGRDKHRFKYQKKWTAVPFRLKDTQFYSPSN